MSADHRVGLADVKRVSSGHRLSNVARTVSRPAERCRIEEPELAELSGLASDGDYWYAASDGESSLNVYALDRGDCSVRDVRGSPVDPYDVEDLALGPDGAVWLADTGDNARQRDTVALHRLSPEGRSALFRLRYPDQPHDAEAMVLDPSGQPWIITKEPFGGAEIYRPTGPLDPDGITGLRRAGSLTLPATGTPGGPFSGGFGSALVTGAAINHEGTVMAVRTYTDAYLFPVSHGDVSTALQTEPQVVPLAGEPQGEAVAWEPDGTLLSGSEGSHQPIRAVPGAESTVTTRNGPPAERGSTPDSPPANDPMATTDPPGDASGGDASEQPDRPGFSVAHATLLAVLAVLILVAAGAARRRSK